MLANIKLCGLLRDWPWPWQSESTITVMRPWPWQSESTITVTTAIFLGDQVELYFNDIFDQLWHGQRPFVTPLRAFAHCSSFYGLCGEVVNTVCFASGSCTAVGSKITTTGSRTYTLTVPLLALNVVASRFHVASQTARWDYVLIVLSYFVIFV